MGNTLYITSDGILRRRNNTLMIDVKGADPRFLPSETTDEIVVFGDVEMNKGLLELLTDKGIIMHIFGCYGRYEGTYYPQRATNSGPLVIAQAGHWLDEDKRHELARLFVTGAIQNMISVADYYRRRRDDAQISGIVDGLRHLEAAARSVPDAASLLGEEGSARSCYYGLFDRVADQNGFRLGKRSRRPPRNFMNALISLLNSMCYTAVLSQIYKTRLDPRISYLHSPSDRRLSLNLDIAEIFKPLLVDRLIFKLVNRRIIRPEHFENAAGGIRMTRDGMKIVLGAWDERLNETVTHPDIEGRRVSWRHLMLMEVWKVQKHVLGKAEYSPYVMR